MTTVVTTAAGVVTKFEDGLSKFIAAHPKWGALVVLVVGFAGGFVVKTVL